MTGKNNANKLFGDLSQQLGMSEEQLKSSAKSGKIDDILKNTDSKQAEQIRAILNDPEKTKQILNSPQAQALLKMFGDKQM